MNGASGQICYVRGGLVHFLSNRPDIGRSAVSGSGFGLPVAEAMAQGTAVVTSRGTSTEEVAGGAAVLVDPFDVDDIARGIAEALDRADELAAPSRRRAGQLSWTQSATATLAVYRELCP